MIIYTVGHSNRSFEEFIRILKKFKVKNLFDVRRFSTSKYHWFSREYLASELESYGIKYFWIPELGGYRKFGRDIEDYGIANCFKSEGFRAYATYIIKNKVAREKLKFIYEIASKEISCLMCSERIPWRCHRKILSDWFLAKGFQVIHIIDLNQIVVHKLSKCAKIVNGKLFYL